MALLDQLLENFMSNSTFGDFLFSDPQSLTPPKPKTPAFLEGSTPTGPSQAQSAGPGNVFILKNNPQGGFTRLMRPEGNPFTQAESQTDFSQFFNAQQPTQQPVQQPTTVQPMSQPTVPAPAAVAPRQTISSVLHQTFGGIPTAQASNSANTDVSKLANAIAIQESGGRYNAISPVNRNGGRAYGKYQVMDSNIPAWTKEVLGYSMTPKQFLNDPEAQEKVGQAKIGQYLQRYGNPADVAAVWFSGRPLKGNYSTDVTGTSVPKYVKNILANLGV